MSLKKPALDPMSLTPRTSSGYPEPYRSRVLPREKRALGDALGLVTIGINHTVLPPGKESSMRHWHTHEEEFIFVLSGEVVLRTDAGEQVLTSGMCAGFPVAAGAKNGDGHQLVNRGTEPAVYLEVSNRDPRDQAYYPDEDLCFHGANAPVRFTRRDGSEF
ncbi:MAG TPA: cupin domain-containing protein [Steroidobacteraceae bacterium]|nr:cupin domain-containing protein [Steroidobacteraceae bacterium]